LYLSNRKRVLTDEGTAKGSRRKKGRKDNGKKRNVEERGQIANWRGKISAGIS